MIWKIIDYYESIPDASRNNSVLYKFEKCMSAVVMKAPGLTPQEQN
jgi:hypothetical protein